MTSAARREAVDIILQPLHLCSPEFAGSHEQTGWKLAERLTPSTSQSASRRRTQSSVLALSSLSCRLILRLRRLGGRQSASKDFAKALLPPGLHRARGRSRATRAQSTTEPSGQQQRGGRSAAGKG